MTPMEARIVKTCITDLIAAGYSLTVNDGEEDTVIASRDPQTVFAAMGTTDEDYLLVSKPRCLDSFVRFVYGNDGWDVINDYGVSLEAVLKSTNELCNRMERMHNYVMDFRRYL